MPPRLTAIRLKKRADFLNAQRGIRIHVQGLMLETALSPKDEGEDGFYRIGFTASRKVGGAVQRNRAKRRLRAAAAAILPDAARECTDYVLIARPATLVRPFQDLLNDLAKAVKNAHLRRDERQSNDRVDR